MKRDIFADHVAAELSHDELPAVTYHDAETLDTALRARTFAARDALQRHVCDALAYRDDGDYFRAGGSFQRAVAIARVWTGESDVPAHARGRK